MIDAFKFGTRLPEEKTDWYVESFIGKQPKLVQDKYNLWLIIIFSWFTLMAFYSVVYAFIRLCRRGVDSNARNNFFWKHKSYIVIMIVIWTI